MLTNHDGSNTKSNNQANTMENYRLK